MNCEETTYTVFLIGGAFIDEDVDILRFARISFNAK